MNGNIEIVSNPDNQSSWKIQILVDDKKILKLSLNYHEDKFN